MKVLHPDPRPTAPRPHALRPRGLRATLAARLAHPLAVLVAPVAARQLHRQPRRKLPTAQAPEVLTVAAAAGNPCAARAGESAALLALRVVLTDRRSAAGGGR